MKGPAPAGEGIGYFAAERFEQDSLPLRPARRIFCVKDGVKWREVATATPCVVYDPDGFGGHGDHVRYKMWFAGVGPKTVSGVGYAILVGNLR